MINKKITPPNLSSQTIDFLRFPMAVMVVFIHSFGFPKQLDLVELQSLPVTGSDIFNYIRICLTLVIPMVAVPSFFLISGYLFFNNFTRWDGDKYQSKMKKRMYSLFIPYLLWNVIAISSTIIIKGVSGLIKHKPFDIMDFFEKQGYWHVFWDSHVMNDTYPNWLMQQVGATAPYNVPLWFLRDLMVVLALVPIIYWLLKHTKGIILLPMLMCYVSDIWINVSGLSITAILFFSFGAYLSIYKLDLITILSKLRKLSYIISPFLIVVLVYLCGRKTTYGNWLMPFYVLFGVVALFNIAAGFVSKGLKWKEYLTASTMFIFVAHNFMIRGYCQTFFGKIMPDNTFGYLLGYLLSPFLCVALCVSLYLLLKSDNRSVGR